MFTGIVEGTGTLVAIDPAGEKLRLRVDLPARIAEGVAIGQSIALDGCCLTVAGIRGTELSFDAIPETLRCTSIGSRKPGDPLNVERALRADARLDGHIVQGHVDATGEVVSLDRTGDDVRMRIRCDRELAELLVPKGSVAVDGIALTVVAPDDSGFEVALVPHTLTVTTLGLRSPGDRVNLEVDVIGKYVHRYLSARRLL